MNILRLFVLCSLLLASCNAARGQWSTTRTCDVGPDAKTFRQIIKVTDVPKLYSTMVSVASQLQQRLGTEAGQISYYTGFSTNPTTVLDRFRDRHYVSNYAFGGEAGFATEWYEICIEFIGDPGLQPPLGAALETFFINQSPSQVFQNKNAGGGGSAGGWLVYGNCLYIIWLQSVRCLLFLFSCCLAFVFLPKHRHYGNCPSSSFI
jgi:hypothetical protein